MQIGEVADRTALTVDAIRFYEKRNLLPKAGRSTGRFRLYTEDTIERLRFIRQMQGLGFSLREIRELIDLRSGCLRSGQRVAKRQNWGMCVQSCTSYGNWNRSYKQICTSAIAN